MLRRFQLSEINSRKNVRGGSRKSIGLKRRFGNVKKSALLDTLIASGNSLNAEFLSVLNEKTERVSVEMEHLPAKRDILNQELPPEEDF